MSNVPEFIVMLWFLPVVLQIVLPLLLFVVLTAKRMLTFNRSTASVPLQNKATAGSTLS